MIFVYVDVHARDLVESPKKPEPEGPKKKAPPKVPSWYHTGEKSMKYINDVSNRQEAKREEEEKYDNARKEAVKKVKSEERKTNKKMTCLTSPQLNPAKPKRVTHRN